jgi:hypothetical protein
MGGSSGWARPSLTAAGTAALIEYAAIAEISAGKLQPSP